MRNVSHPSTLMTAATIAATQRPNLTRRGTMDTKRLAWGASGPHDSWQPLYRQRQHEFGDTAIWITKRRPNPGGARRLQAPEPALLGQSASRCGDRACG